MGMTTASKFKQLPAYADPGFFFETVKDGEVVDSKFQNLMKALESIETWPVYDRHKASIRLGRYI